MPAASGHSSRSVVGACLPNVGFFVPFAFFFFCPVAFFFVP